MIFIYFFIFYIFIEYRLTKFYNKTVKDSCDTARKIAEDEKQSKVKVMNNVKRVKDKNGTTISTVISLERAIEDQTAYALAEGHVYRNRTDIIADILSEVGTSLTEEPIGVKIGKS